MQKILSISKYPLVVKADGLAAGKGVYICKKFEEGFAAAEKFWGKFGDCKIFIS